MAPSRTPSGGGGGMLGSLKRFWQRTYASDYIGFSILLVGYLMFQFFVEPFHRMFSLNDLRIAFPHAEIERVPLLHDFIYALFLPILILVVYNLSTSASAHKHHVTVLGLAIAMVLTSFLTDVIKNMVGRPRPDLLARCVPRAGTPADTLVTIDVCTQTDRHTLHDGWRSFPSGHSSFAFAGLGHLSLFLAGQTRIFAHAAHLGGGGGGRAEHAEKLVRGDLIRALACLAPLLGATLIAISRCQDYRHDVYDVCVGSLLGWTVTYWSYRRYWPRLGSGRCDEPYAGPPAADGLRHGHGGASGLGESGGYGRVRDEEEGVGGNVGPFSHRGEGYEMGEWNRRP